MNRELLEDVQGNILQPHGRRNVALLMISFAPATSRLPSIQSWIRALAFTHVRSALAEYTDGAIRTSPFCSFLLSARGYRVLGATAPSHRAFSEGMSARRANLNDPPRDLWEVGYRDTDIDALLVLADDDSVRLAYSVVTHRRDAMATGSSMRVVESGRQLRRDGQDIEHFGFVDGISQPEFLENHVTEVSSWDSSAPLDLALVEEPGDRGSFGSYLVLRKLEQDVALWNHNLSMLAREMKVDPETAGALVMGRCKNGTPVGESREISAASSLNDFNYLSDPTGERCPLFAHTRKINPRGETSAGSLEDERKHRIVRRSITYGLRPDLHPGGRLFPAPRAGVGLLFMCFQSNIENQFEHLQGKWANNANHCYPASGMDPVIGQPGEHTKTGAAPVPTSNASLAGLSRVASAVRMLGGEYFFAPSISYLRRIGT